MKITPKEKADELMMKFLLIQDSNDAGWAGMNKKMARECIDIVLAEVLTAQNTIYGDTGTNGKMFDEFYEKVKIESKK